MYVRELAQCLFWILVFNEYLVSLFFCVHVENDYHAPATIILGAAIGSTRQECDPCVQFALSNLDFNFQGDYLRSKNNQIALIIQMVRSGIELVELITPHGLRRRVYFRP